MLCILSDRLHTMKSFQTGRKLFMKLSNACSLWKYNTFDWTDEHHHTLPHSSKTTRLSYGLPWATQDQTLIIVLKPKRKQKTYVCLQAAFSVVLTSRCFFMTAWHTLLFIETNSSLLFLSIPMDVLRPSPLLELCWMGACMECTDQISTVTHTHAGTEKVIPVWHLMISLG